MLYDHSRYEYPFDHDERRPVVTLCTNRSESPDPFAWAGGWTAFDRCSLDDGYIEACLEHRERIAQETLKFHRGE